MGLSSLLHEVSHSLCLVSQRFKLTSWETNMTYQKSLSYLLILLSLIPALAYAQNKVVVVPLIGNESELKPINPSNVIDVRRAFTTTSDRATIGTVTAERGIILSNITVAPEEYPTTLSTISLRFCRDGGGCSHSISVPNNTISKIDFGLGELFTFNGEYYIDIVDRGGLPQNVANQISIHISGYFYNK